MAVRDVVVVEVEDKAEAVVDRGCHVFVAEERLEAHVATGFVGKRIGSRVRRSAANRAALRTMNGDALKVGRCQCRIRHVLRVFRR